MMDTAIILLSYIVILLVFYNARIVSKGNKAIPFVMAITDSLVWGSILWMVILNVFGGNLHILGIL